MSNVSIFEKKWIDLVFENKNQAYGAYQLRQENPKTVVTAFFYAVLFMILITGTIILFSSFSANPAPVKPIVTPLVLIDVVYPPTVEPIVIPKLQPKQALKSDVTKKDLVNVVLVKTADNPDDIRDNNESLTSINPTDKGVIGGTSSDPVPTISTPTDGVPNSVIPNNTIINTVSLDEMPEFPGGISRFYEYVGNNFEKPELESGTVITVYVSFVIEKDGKMTDIKVLRNPGFGMGQEAIRVLKSLKTNWKSGVKDGQKVRTLYTLPIKVKSE